jgi:hypothetical protein
MNKIKLPKIFYYLGQFQDEDEEEDIILSQRANADTGKRNSLLSAPKYFNTFGKGVSVFAGLKCHIAESCRYWYFAGFIVTCGKWSYFFSVNRDISWSGDADSYLVAVYTGNCNFYAFADDNTLILFSGQHKHTSVLSIFNFLKSVFLIKVYD